MTPAIARKAPAYLTLPVTTFLGTTSDEILGALSRAHGGSVEASQLDAWEQEVAILRGAVSTIQGTLFFEFDIPRLGSRIDVVLVSGGAVFPIEFKCGARRFVLRDQHQAWDYGLDLKNFHKESHEASILPILVATDSPHSEDKWPEPHADGVRPPMMTNAAGLGPALRLGIELVKSGPIDAERWGASPYRPTPTIVEAARALYSRHSVAAIARHDAEARNLTETSGAIEVIIERARTTREKAIVFITGVPGAGKTLVGLNVATETRNEREAHAVFLSGNGPLVDVLREALTRDEQSRTPDVRKGVIQQRVKQFIQNVHHFRDEGIRREQDPPTDHVVIFDEAQRAWDLRKTADFMKRRKRIPNFTQSEPEFLLSYMDRHREWAVVICLVGGGQEINDGEAGIGAWLSAIQERFSNWRVFLSRNLTESEYAAADAIAELPKHQVAHDEKLHLSTSMRSFRSERVSAFVKSVLDIDEAGARQLHAEFQDRYPIVVTRDIDRAKQWVKSQARGSERYGLVASSEALRLRPHAIDVRPKINPIHYFLNDRDDVRSSFYLEDAATQFQVQGLELDWICMAWCADLRLQDGRWRYHAFRGDRWTNVKSTVNQRYLKNAYRVLMTRARQGFAIFVPPGNEDDPTRRPSYYDETFEYFRRIGIRAI